MVSLESTFCQMCCKLAEEIPDVSDKVNYGSVKLIFLGNPLEEKVNDLTSDSQKANWEVLLMSSVAQLHDLSFRVLWNKSNKLTLPFQVLKLLFAFFRLEQHTLFICI